ncbi:hypothetical protein SAMN05444141_104391 [Pseudovibrio denitrificans]|uniref:Uncharacterized protein n=1 Tax=Pseudovibrio denitrificans TaxID=258256 RepID=A0A1I7BVN2_9HYPH|nr:hypothetical protein SAMN05444141_104391 [Pseudovibrio denitrificans]
MRGALWAFAVSLVSGLNINLNWKQSITYFVSNLKLIGSYLLGCLPTLATDSDFVRKFGVSVLGILKGSTTSNIQFVELNVGYFCSLFHRERQECLLLVQNSRHS